MVVNGLFAVVLVSDEIDVSSLLNTKVVAFVTEDSSTGKGVLVVVTEVSGVELDSIASSRRLPAVDLLFSSEPCKLTGCGSSSNLEGASSSSTTDTDVGNSKVRVVCVVDADRAEPSVSRLDTKCRPLTKDVPVERLEARKRELIKKFHQIESEIHPKVESSEKVGWVGQILTQIFSPCFKLTIRVLEKKSFVCVWIEEFA